MTKQEQEDILSALDYALNKCSDDNGDAETHYNTIANAINVVKKCRIAIVSGSVSKDKLKDKLKGMRKFSLEHFNQMSASGSITTIYEIESWLDR